MTSWLSEEMVSGALQTRWLGRHVTYFAEVDSTNEWLKRQAGLDPGLADGALVVADYQSRGKGRLDRRWDAPANSSLLLSLFFRLHWAEDQANWLTMIAGLAAVEAIAAQTGLEAKLKWPNDLVVAAAEDGWRKLGGILLESTWQSGRMVQAVLGIGLNVNVPAGELPQTRPRATSLLVETGGQVDRLSLLADLLWRLEARFEAACAGESPMPAWLERQILIGMRVQVITSESRAQVGILESIDRWGSLQLRSEDGTLHTIPAGDVSLRREKPGPPAHLPV